MTLARYSNIKYPSPPFWFVLNFHWTALGIIILPSQVFKMVCDAYRVRLNKIERSFVLLFAISVANCQIGTVTVRYIREVKR